MQGRPNFGADTRDTENHRKVEKKKESNRPERHPHLKAEEEKEYQPYSEQSGSRAVTHRFTGIVRRWFATALRDPEYLPNDASIVPSSHPQRDASERDPSTRLLFEVIDIACAKHICHDHLKAGQEPEEPARKREIQRCEEHQPDAKRIEGDANLSHRTPRF